AHLRRVARGAAQLARPDRPLAVAPPQAELEPASALAARFQLALHVAGEIGDDAIERLAVTDRLEQPPLHPDRRGGDDRQQRLGGAAEQLVQPLERIVARRAAVAEAAPERVAAGSV